MDYKEVFERNNIKNNSNGGRPSFYNDVESLSKAISDYFNSLKGEYDKKKKEWTIQPTQPTITGLALFLGFESRQSFYDYEKNSEYSYIIKRSRLIVENCHELGLHSNNNTGHIFALKVMGWNDKPIDDGVLADIDLTKLEPHEATTYLALMKKLRVE